MKWCIIFKHINLQRCTDCGTLLTHIFVKIKVFSTKTNFCFVFIVSLDRLKLLSIYLSFNPLIDNFLRFGSISRKFQFGALQLEWGLNGTVVDHKMQRSWKNYKSQQNLPYCTNEFSWATSEIRSSLSLYVHVIWWKIAMCNNEKCPISMQNHSLGMF